MMENSAQKTNTDSEEFIQWYVDMIENYPNTFVHYLSDDALLQWFGRSIRGPERILYFIKSNIQGRKHIIGIQNPAVTPEDTTVDNEPLPNGNCSPKSCANDTETKLNFTPESHFSTVHFDLFEHDEFACGDGPNIDKLPLKNNAQGSSKTQTKPINIFETTGAIEFCRPCYKRGVVDTKWERPCTLTVGYAGNLANPVEFSIQLIIYGDNMPCKRNLLPEFNQCVSD